jgi:hypothetical protein
MKLLKISISIFITSLLLCGNAFAKPGDDKPPVEVDVNVVNVPDVNVINSIEWRFVGYTATETTGDVHDGALSGYSAMNMLCNREHNLQKARICTSAEIRRSTIPTRAGAGLSYAWVAPSTTVLVPLPDGELFQYDPQAPNSVGTSSSLFNARSLDCANWNTDLSGASGLVLVASNDTGVQLQQMGRESCEHTYPIVCCAPVEVPVQ